MSELIFSYLIDISNVLIYCIFIRIVADIFRDFVFLKGGKWWLIKFMFPQTYHQILFMEK